MARSKIIKNNKALPKNKAVKKYKRANGEGTIYQRKDGRWAGAVTIGYDENGKQIKKTVYGRNQTEVAKKLSDISGRLKSNSYEVIEKKTFGQLMFEWLLVFKKSAVTPRTFEGIIRNFRLHIEPIIGNMKIYEIDTYVVQKVINKLIDGDYSLNVIKKNKHLIAQFFDYAIDNKWVTENPTRKIRIKIKDRKIYSGQEKYKALTPEARKEFLTALNQDEANFLKPLCYVLLFAGLRIGEAIALQWKNVNFENKTLKVERSVTQVPKFDSEGRILSRATVIGDTKTTCSVREIPITDIVVNTLLAWRDKQIERERTNRDVTAELTAPTSFIFANDDGSVRTYSGCRMVFDRFKRRHNLDKYNIHFHGLRHTFSNMLFEMNENPKVIQQLLGHRDVKTTITVYNSVDNEYIRNTTEKLNEKIKQEKLYEDEKRRQEEINTKKNDLLSNTDEEYDDLFKK